MLVPEIAQKVRCGNLRFPDWVLLAGDALRVAELGHSNTLVGQVNVDLEIVWRWIIDFDGVADTLVVLGLIVWTGHVVIEFLDVREILHHIARNRQSGRRCELYLSETDVVDTICVCQIRLFSNDANYG